MRDWGSVTARGGVGVREFAWGFVVSGSVAARGGVGVCDFAWGFVVWVDPHVPVVPCVVDSASLSVSWVSGIVLIHVPRPFGGGLFTCYLHGSNGA